MLDLKLLRHDPEHVTQRLQLRGLDWDRALFADLEARRKSLQTDSERLQAERNALAKKIGQSRAQGVDVSDLMQQAQAINERLQADEGALAVVQGQLEQHLLTLPNLPHDSVPPGRGEEDNVEVRRHGQPRAMNFTARDHVDLGEALGLLDLEVAAKITGARFSVLKGGLARLQRALTQFMLDLHSVEHGYTEVYVPYLVNADSLRGTGQLPKFAEDLFVLQGERPYYLIPTAEVPVTNLLRDSIVDAAQLPLKWVCHTPCFRSEAGAYGKDTRGLIRQHQFEKVELVQMVPPSQSYTALEQLTAHAEEVLRRLDLPYRVVSVCGGDLGFSAAKTYDLEVWLPGQSRYREISSCSNFEDFQARRLQARWRTSGSKPELLHTLNGSGLAVGRTLVAILENYQDESGRIAIPDCLQSYMRGQTHLR